MSILIFCFNYFYEKKPPIDINRIGGLIRPAKINELKFS